MVVVVVVGLEKGGSVAVVRVVAAATRSAAVVEVIVVIVVTKMPSPTLNPSYVRPGSLHIKSSGWVSHGFGDHVYPEAHVVAVDQTVRSVAVLHIVNNPNSFPAVSITWLETAKSIHYYMLNISSSLLLSMINTALSQHHSFALAWLELQLHVLLLPGYLCIIKPTFFQFLLNEGLRLAFFAFGGKAVWAFRCLGPMGAGRT